MDLPNEWEICKLSEKANIIMGQSPPGSSYNEIGQGTPFLQGKAEFGEKYPQNTKYTTDPKKISPKKAILLSVRAPVGNVNLADKEYCIGRGLASINMFDGDNLYLYYLLIHNKKILENEGYGSTFKAINKNKIINLELAFPPLPEQKRSLACSRRSRRRASRPSTSSRRPGSSSARLCTIFSPTARYRWPRRKTSRSRKLRSGWCRRGGRLKRYPIVINLPKNQENYP